MRFIFSVIGFALFVVGCQSIVPTTERTIELPTLKYQEQATSYKPRSNEGNSFSIAEEKSAIRAIRESCRRFGKFSIVSRDGNETYSCSLEK